MQHNCFQTYYDPAFIYIKNVYLLAISNNYEALKLSFIMSYLTQIVNYVFKIDIFGVSSFLLMLVITTVLIDAYYGILKSIKKSKENYALALEQEQDSYEQKRYFKISEMQKFSPKKLQFTFFKCATLLGYLYVAKNLLESEVGGGTISEIIGFASGIATKAPLAIFWYYDFKSIGENSEFVFGKKAPIFIIVEKMFEPKINVLFNDKKE